MYNPLELFVLFQVKHLVVDFFVQNRFPVMWQNKHNIRHPGGWLHAISHGYGTAMILLPLFVTNPGLWGIIAVGETLMHYFIDWSKMNINIKTGWKANTSPYFWDLLGIDQFLHQITYIGICYLLL